MFCKDEAEREAFEERGIALYMDFRPFLKGILEDLAGPARS